MDNGLEPARTVIGLISSSGRLSGVKTLAEWAGVHRTAPHRWLKAKACGGTGGLIPSKHHIRILAAARKNGIPLRAEDLIGVDEACVNGNH